MSADTRKHWNYYFLDIAEQVATRSTCDRKHVGCVIVIDRRVVATGYNGSIKGEPHCDEVGHDLQDVIQPDGTRAPNCVRTVHAEANAVAQAARFGVRLDGGTAYVNTYPCWPCFRLMVNAGIKAVIFRDGYRIDPRVLEASVRLGIRVEGPGCYYCGGVPHEDTPSNLPPLCAVHGAVHDELKRKGPVKIGDVCTRCQGFICAMASQPSKLMCLCSTYEPEPKPSAALAIASLPRPTAWDKKEIRSNDAPPPPWEHVGWHCSRALCDWNDSKATGLTRSGPCPKCGATEIVRNEACPKHPDRIVNPSGPGCFPACTECPSVGLHAHVRTDDVTKTCPVYLAHRDEPKKRGTSAELCNCAYVRERIAEGGADIGISPACPVHGYDRPEAP